MNVNVVREAEATNKGVKFNLAGPEVDGHCDSGDVPRGEDENTSVSFVSEHCGLERNPSVGDLLVAWGKGSPQHSSMSADEMEMV